MTPAEILSARRVKRFLSRAIETHPDRSSSGDPMFLDLWPARWDDLGLRPGDIVVLALPNGVRLLDHFFGVLAAGGVPALTPPRTPASRLLDMASELDARAVAAVESSTLAADLGLSKSGADFLLAKLRRGGKL